MTHPHLSRRELLSSLLGAGALLGLSSGCGPASAPRPGPGGGGLPRLLLPHPSGARVEIFLQGAHVASWIRPDGEDALFLSRRSRLEPGIPIRGGIPVVFPQFASLGPLPSHGLVRTLPWEVAESGREPDGRVFALLRRTDSEATRAHWPHRFRAELLVSLGESLATTLSITNTDARPFSFQTALHTYLRVVDVARSRVEGLEGLPYLDRTADGVERPGSPTPLRITGAVDRIYPGAPDRIVVRDPAGGRSVVVEKEGFADVVVWNPGAERARAMSDLGPEEHSVMLCVEPASIAVPVRLEPGQAWSGVQRIAIA